VIVSREKLIDLARNETKMRSEEGDVISAYIIGSVASGNPVLGGTADIDLVIIHRKEPEIDHEIHPFSNDFHLDISHHSSDLYDRPTDLRIDPWLGPTMCEPLFLYDPHHFFERAQAGVRGQFHRADHVYKRARAFLQRARDFRANLGADGKWISTYLQSLLEGANAVATLSGFPAAGRRLVLVLESRIEKVEQKGFFDRFLQLHGADRISEEQLKTWIAQWDQTATVNLVQDDQKSVARHQYYYSGLEALLSQGRPEIILWNVLDRWGEAINNLYLAGSEGQHRENWESALGILGLHEPRQNSRADELEIYLDDIEEFLEIWADQHGA
jgi:hypothetical protein